MAAPCGSPTPPKRPYSGSIPSISENTLPTRSTSMIRPFAAGSPFTCQQAATRPMAAYMPAKSSLIETPQRGGGSSDWPGEGGRGGARLEVPGSGGGVGEAPHRLADGAEGRLVAVGPILAVAADAGDDEAG